MFEKLGKFAIKGVLGRGAMGEVYLGEDPAIGREVAIKTILPAATQGTEAKQRFEREARAAGVLNHPNIVTIYEFGEDQGVLYIAMELVRGHDLEELIQQQALTHSEALEVLAQVCDGLGFAHRNGIVHRDIKPANVRVLRDGKRLQAKVMDFGVARVSNSDMTATGMVMGTVSYMAPEYIQTGKPDPRSDLFAVGVMLYESLSGRKPFAGDTTPTILYRIVNDAPEPLDPAELRGVSPAIHSVLDRALQKDPALRHQTAEELAKALRAAKDPTWHGELPEATARLASAGPTVAVPAAPVTRPTATAPGLPRPAVPPPAKGPSGVVFATVAALLGLALLGAGGYAFWKFRPQRPRTEAPAAPVQQVAPPAPETPLPAAPAQAAVAEPAPVRAQPPAPPVIEPRHRADGDSGAPAPRAEVPAPAPAPVSPFSQEHLQTLSAAERMNLSLATMSDATRLVETNPPAAVDGLRNAIAANPGNANAYAWLVAVLYEQGRYGEIPQVLARARRNGIPRGALAQNLRFRMAMQNERFNHRIPGGQEPGGE